MLMLRYNRGTHLTHVIRIAVRTHPTVRICEVHIFMPLNVVTVPILLVLFVGCLRAVLLALGKVCIHADFPQLLIYGRILRNTDIICTDISRYYVSGVYYSRSPSTLMMLHIARCLHNTHDHTFPG